MTYCASLQGAGQSRSEGGRTGGATACRPKLPVCMADRGGLCIIVSFTMMPRL